ncbi:OsmC family protein [Microbacterium sp.]|uniref:OsmC family protein n=1 Tax=Microbacterium sp. TaxID=51671 RepID=UPI003A8DFE3F
MRSEHTYRLHTAWTGNRGTGTTGYRDYDRSVTISADGRPDLLASADRTFHGDGSRWNPEDMLVAALSECHLLSYLHAAVKAGVVVTGYDDDASGVMTEDGRGGGAFTEVVLRPRVTVAEASMVDAATSAHRQAHEWCFIANSVNFPVRIEPGVSVSAARAEALA